MQVTRRFGRLEMFQKLKRGDVGVGLHVRDEEGVSSTFL
jgi:hypothetical protein